VELEEQLQASYWGQGCFIYMTIERYERRPGLIRKMALT